MPFWAHSAGTLIALGADTIYMTPFATLSPIDPSVTNQFNPWDAANPDERIPIAVEDVLAFFQLVFDDAALPDRVTRLTIALYSHSHLIPRAEAAALGLPVEQPSEDREDRLLQYYEQLRADLELLERFDHDATLDLPVALERAYVETPSTCDAFVTRVATPEVTTERWEMIA